MLERKQIFDRQQLLLTYRGDSLKNVESLKEAQVNIFQYFKLGPEKKLIYPTPNKIWLNKKANLTLKKKILKNLSNAPKDFVFDLSNLSSIDGWSKRLEGFLLNILTIIHKKTNTAVSSKSKKVKKHFPRGEQLLDDNFIDIAFIYSKQSNTLFCLKAVCAASLKKQNHWTFMALSKHGM